MFKLLIIILALFTIATAKEMQLKTTATETVYLQNYDVAETDYTFYQTLNYTGSLGKIGFLKVPTPVTSDVQTVVRMNRDTLYGYGVFDLNCSVTIELPSNKGRYLSLYALDNYQYSLALLHSNETKSASITFSYQNEDNSTNKNSHEKKQSNINKIISDTRYIYVIIRVFADPNDPVDVLKANLLQDAVKITQTSVGEWSWTNWSIDSLVEVRTALSSLESYIEPDTQINGYRNEIDPTVHLIATATSWGGNPPEEAVYFLVSPPSLTDLSQVYYIDIESPSSIPVKSTGFWSVTVYNENNYLEYNNASSYSVNGVTATPESDGSIRIYFSNTQADDMSNWLYIFPGWNYVVRLYLPEDVVINNTWTFPALQEL